uniref:Innexin n=1 Tax=Panagrolaimus sp. JU765 TaxID=591449 RepID=A0AC34Q237_9BILA
MGITSLAALLSFVTSQYRDGDFFDRINYRYVPYFLITLGLTFFAREYMGHPIDCWQKPDWVSSWIEYAADYCLVEGTFYVPVNETYPKAFNFEGYPKVNFYQWLPFTFCFLGLALIFPRKYWDFVNWSSPLHMNVIFSNVSQKNLANPRNFAKTVFFHIQDVLERQKSHHGFFANCLHRLFLSRYLTVNYFLVKILNFVMTVVVFYCLTYFVADNDTHPFGLPIFKNLLNGVKWTESGVFPRVTVCVFHIREISRHGSRMTPKSVQCVLTANMLTEVFYIIAYIVLLTAQAFNFYSFIQYCWKLTIMSRVSFVRQLVMNSLDFVWPPVYMDEKIRSAQKEENKERQEKAEKLKIKLESADKETANKAEMEFEDYIDELSTRRANRAKKRDAKREKYMEEVDSCIVDFVHYLGTDVTLLIRLLATNSNETVAGALVGRLFWKFCKNNQKSDDNNNI